jgi:hypothetical protein
VGSGISFSAKRAGAELALFAIYRIEKRRSFRGCLLEWPGLVTGKVILNESFTGSTKYMLSM